MKKISVWLLTMGLSFLVFQAQAANFECGGKTILLGTTQAEVAARCGKPTWQDVWEEEIIEVIERGVERRRILSIDEWAYNQGPNRFVKILKFRNGKLMGVRDGGYGYLRDRIFDPTCDEKKLSIGDTRVDVLIKCGDPTFKYSWKEEIIKRIDPLTEQKFTLVTDEWTYNPGPHRFLRILRFNNGKLIHVKYGDYGY